MNRTMLRTIRCLLLAACGLLCAVAAQAQSPTGEISGVVKDNTGAVVPGAQLSLVNQNTGEARSVESNEAGEYRLPLLPVGVYQLTAQRDGFKASLRRDLELNALQSLRVDFALEVGAVGETVTVTAQAPLVDTRSTIQGMLIDDRRVKDLPLNGRNAIDLAQLDPGVTFASTTIRTSFNQQRIRLNGGRETSTNFVLDGGQTNYNHRGRGLPLPPPDAIQEFKVVTSGVPAEFGRGFGVISAVTKSGTNEWHGSAWEFLRNDAFDARSFFAPTVPKLRFNQFGGTFGGPVRQNKTFFFASYQGLRAKEEESQIANVPTAAQRAGDFSALTGRLKDPSNTLPCTAADQRGCFAGNRIPTNRFDPVAAKLLASNLPAANRGTQYVSLEPLNTTDDQALGRVDHNLTQNNRLMARYFFAYSRGRDSFPNGSTIGRYSPTNTSTRFQTITVEDVHTLSPTMLNTLRFNYTRFNYLEANTVKQSLNDLGATDFTHAGGPGETMPRIIVTGFFTISPGRDRQRFSDNFDIAENLTWTAGNHQLKFGVDYQRNRFIYNENFRTGGEFQFDGGVTGNALADFLLGTARRFFQQSPLATSQAMTIAGLYVQDSWRAHPRLTVNAGLRWEYFGPWLEADGQAVAYVPGARSTVSPTAPLGYVFQNDDAFPYRADKNNFAPRVGLAWDVFGDGRTSVRASYGISYDPLTAEMAGGEAVPQPFGLLTQFDRPFALSAPYRGRTNPYPYQPNLANASFVLPIAINKSFDANVVAPYVQSWTLGVQRQLTDSMLLDVAYVGNVGRHIVLPREINPAIYRAGDTRPTDARRLLAPNFGSIGQLFTDSNTSYNGLQAQLQRRFSRGLTVSVAYTWAKALDESGGDKAFANVSGAGNVQNPFDRRAEKGRTDGDVRHRLVTSYLYELPFFRGNNLAGKVLGGWELGGILTMRTGQPFRVNTGRDNAQTGNSNTDRPDLIGDPKLSSDRPRGEQVARFFNTAAFRANAVGTFGTAGRNIIQGPGYFNWDMSLKKAFRITEGHQLQFRWDVFNVPNRPNFNSLVTNLNAPTFGQIDGVEPGRIMQFSLKYVF
jgi:outer membrane receptor protein involved in Fe transport